MRKCSLAVLVAGIGLTASQVASAADLGWRVPPPAPVYVPPRQISSVGPPLIFGNRLGCRHYFHRFPPRLEVRIFSSATGNSASLFKKPFQSFCRLAPAVSVFERLGPSTFLPRILWAR